MLFTILKLLQAILVVLEYSFSDNTLQYNAQPDSKQPFAVDPLHLLVSPNVLTNEAIAGLHYVMTTNLSVSSQLRSELDRANKLVHMLQWLPPNVAPARDARQIVASRFARKFFSGAISGKTFAGIITGIDTSVAGLKDSIESDDEEDDADSEDMDNDGCDAPDVDGDDGGGGDAMQNLLQTLQMQQNLMMKLAL